MIKNNVWVNQESIYSIIKCIVSAPNHTKCISLSNQKCMIQSTLINFHSNEYSQEINFYPFVVNQIDVLEVVILSMIYLIEYVSK